MSALTSSDYKYLTLLKLSPFERRASGGGWRFGTRRIADSVVDRLTASGRAAIAGDRLHLVERIDSQ
jgi:hypothetical protein